MSNKYLYLDTSKIMPCKSITIKDPYYENNLWCAFHTDNCTDFTHAKCAAVNYSEHYKDEEFEFDMNITEFAFLVGIDKVINLFKIEQENNGNLSVSHRLSDKLVTTEMTEIGCETAQFSFGTEKTFGEFSINTGADGGIGDVYLYKNKYNNMPIGLLFMGSCSGDIVSPEKMIDSFVAAFGIERTREKSFNDKISDAENRKTKNTFSDKNDREKLER